MRWKCKDADDIFKMQSLSGVLFIITFADAWWVWRTRVLRLLLSYFIHCNDTALIASKYLSTRLGREWVSWCNENRHDVISKFLVPATLENMYKNVIMKLTRNQKTYLKYDTKCVLHESLIICTLATKKETQEDETRGACSSMKKMKMWLESLKGRPLGWSSSWWEDNIKIELREMELEGMVWNHVIQDKT